MLHLDESGVAPLSETDRWGVIRSIGLEFGALIGLGSVVWVVILCVTGWKPRGLRNATRLFVAIGLATLIAFNVTFPIFLHPIEAFWPLMVYLVLPVFGVVYFLHQQRNYIGF